MMGENNETNKNKVEEYKDVSANMRQYANMRFAQLTLFIATSGAMVGVAFKPAAQVAAPRWTIRTIGILLSVVFWLLEGRSTAYWNVFMSRAKELERDLLFSQYLNRPDPPELAGIKMNATNAIHLLFGSIVAFWILHWLFGW
jgi:hypothetical protein